MVNDHHKNIRAKIAQRFEDNALRELKVRSSGTIDFCSNDYLGLASNSEIHQHEQLRDTYGSTGSRLIAGQHPVFESAEKYLAEYYGAESALIFNSGYDANLGFYATVPQRGDTVLYDELVHASIRDGIRLGYAHAHSFQHNSIDDLKEKVKVAKGQVFVAVESIYSMDGDHTPLKELSELCSNENCLLVVDEAHAIGTLGDGKGLAAHLDLNNKVFARVVTFGKALGGHGAAVLGKKLLKQFLVNFCRTFIYTTAMPTTSVLTIQKAHEYMANHCELIDQLVANVDFFLEQVQESGWDIIPSKSPVQCIVVPGNQRVKKLAQYLNDEGFDVRPILSPTVAEGKERLRICIHSFNTKKEINQLVESLNTFE